MGVDRSLFFISWGKSWIKQILFTLGRKRVDTKWNWLFIDHLGLCLKCQIPSLLVSTLYAAFPLSARCSVALKYWHFIRQDTNTHSHTCPQDERDSFCALLQWFSPIFNHRARLKTEVPSIFNCTLPLSLSLSPLQQLICALCQQVNCAPSQSQSTFQRDWLKEAVRGRPGLVSVWLNIVSLLLEQIRVDHGFLSPFRLKNETYWKAELLTERATNWLYWLISWLA